MARISKQIQVGYTPEQMYDLVNDIKAYSSFIPLCSRSEVHEQYDHKLRATLTIAKGKAGFSFTTLNFMKKGRSIVMVLENGPFKSFKGVWHFNPYGFHGCSVSLEFEFEFANKLLNAAFSGIFKQLCESMVDSFKKEAIARYG